MQTIMVNVHPRPGAKPLIARQINAEVYGRWAVHRTPTYAGGEDPESHSVTHVPSGLAAAIDMDKAAARRLANIFAVVLDVVEWAPEHTTIALREIKRIRGWV